MFNGIIFNQGKIQKIIKGKKGINLFIKSNLNLRKDDLGISIACDGVCLTLISIKAKVIEFYLSNETLNRSKFKKIKLNQTINLEVPLKFGQKISGHICQGHVDFVANVKSLKVIDRAYVFDFSFNKKFKKHLIEKASILVNGVSLTISKINKNIFQVWVIPHTLKLTNLSNLKRNDSVNIEVDILSKYVRRYYNEK
jgi:riboflavin synthase